MNNIIKKKNKIQDTKKKFYLDKVLVAFVLIFLVGLFVGKNQIIKLAYKIKSSSTIEFNSKVYDLKGYTVVSVREEKGIVGLIDDDDKRNKIIILELIPPISNVDEKIRSKIITIQTILKERCYLLTFNQKERAHHEMVFDERNGLFFSFERGIFNEDALKKMCSGVDVKTNPINTHERTL